MAGGLRPFVTAFIWTLLFTFLIMTFATTFIVSNNNEYPLGNEFNDTITSMNKSLSGFQAYGEYAKDKLSKESPTGVSTYIFLIFSGAFYIPVAIMSYIGAGFNVLTELVFKGIFGSGPIGPLILTTVAAVFAITLVFLIIKYVRTGEGER